MKRFILKLNANVDHVAKKASSQLSNIAQSKRLKNVHEKTAVKKSRSTTPIRSTLQTVKGLPDTVKIYKIPASDNYYVRLYDGNWIKQTTKSTSKEINLFNLLILYPIFRTPLASY